MPWHILYSWIKTEDKTQLTIKQTDFHSKIDMQTSAPCLTFPRCSGARRTGYHLHARICHLIQNVTRRHTHQLRFFQISRTSRRPFPFQKKMRPINKIPARFCPKINRNHFPPTELCFIFYPTRGFLSVSNFWYISSQGSCFWSNKTYQEDSCIPLEITFFFVSKMKRYLSLEICFSFKIFEFF